jgi:hypothetical protein
MYGGAVCSRSARNVTSARSNGYETNFQSALGHIQPLSALNENGKRIFTSI